MLAEHTEPRLGLNGVMEETQRKSVLCVFTWGWSEISNLSWKVRWSKRVFLHNESAPLVYLTAAWVQQPRNDHYSYLREGKEDVRTQIPLCVKSWPPAQNEGREAENSDPTRSPYQLNYRGHVRCGVFLMVEQSQGRQSPESSNTQRSVPWILSIHD